MSNLYQGGQQGAGAGGVAGTTQFFSQMMMMPFSAFVYGMQVFVQMLQGMQQAGGQVWGAGGGFADDRGTRTTGGAAAGSAGITGRTTREEERTMSDQSVSGRDQQWGGGQGPGGMGQGWGNGGDQGWSVRDECRDTEACDRLRLVRFKVLFLKRDLEVAFPEQEELVAEDMPKDGFISWKIAEFIQQMSRGEVAQPGKWAEKDYPESQGGVVRDGMVISLPDKDKRFLRVYCQVLEWYDRERMNYERDQVDVLREIRDELRGLKKGI
jgi:hypothetical protein